jgi:Ser/Thr protein kinase RdoA (MazF antagonist)
MAFELYGLRASARALPGERDCNFYLKTEAGREFVLKIAPTGEHSEILDLQNKALEHLAAHDPLIFLPHVCATLVGETTATVPGVDDSTHFVRLLTYVPGRLFAETKPHTPELLHSLGSFLGRMDRALQNFMHPAAQRE